MGNKRKMREDFAAMIRATEKCMRPWKIATGILSLAIVILVIMALLK